MKRSKKKRIRAWIFTGVFLALAAGLVIWFISSMSKPVPTWLTNESQACAGLEKLNLSGSQWVSVANNGQLELLLRPDTAEIAVHDIINNKFYYSNPQDRDTDTIAKGAGASQLSTQVAVMYADSKNNIAEVNSYDLAVKNKQVAYYALQDGLKVFYDMREQVEESLLPEVISYSDFQNDLLPMFTSAKDRRKIEEAYMPVFFEPELLTTEEKATITSIYGGKAFLGLASDEKANYAAKYPNIEEVKNVFVLNATGLKASSAEKLLVQYGVTLEDKYRYEELVGVIHEESMAVTASLEYRLSGGELLVTAPSQDVSCSGGDGGGFKVIGMRILPMFGASGIAEEGYALLPDGAGALIQFKDKPRANMSMSLSVYGVDQSIANRTNVIKAQPMMLPMYGIVSGDQALMALIEEGESLATLNVLLAGRTHNYNAVYTEFTIAGNTQISLQAVAGEAAVRTYQAYRYMDDFTLRYFFLSGEEASYSGMAAKLRDKWTKDGYFDKRTDEGSYSLMIELLMGIDKTRSVLGFPVKSVATMTSFDQAAQLLEKLREAGVLQMTVKLAGWQKGGTNHGLQTNGEADKSVGGNTGLENLLSAAKSLGATVYQTFGASTIDTTKAGIFSGLNVNNDVVKTLRREPARLYQYNMATGILDRGRQMRYLLTDTKKQAIANAYYDSIKDKTWNIAFEDLGALVISDYNPDRPVTRAASQSTDEALLDMLSKDRLAMGDAVNAYAYPYVDYIAGVPATSSLMDIYDASVPFVQMVLHGYRNYSIEYLNTTDMSRDEMLLRLLETGSEPAFFWMAAGDDMLRETDYQDYYSISYGPWLENAVTLYKEAKDILSKLSGQVIKSHEWLNQDVALVIYEKGTEIYINYGKTAYRSGGLSVPPGGYLVKEGAQ